MHDLAKFAKYAITDIRLPRQLNNYKFYRFDDDVTVITPTNAVFAISQTIKGMLWNEFLTNFFADPYIYLNCLSADITNNAGTGSSRMIAGLFAVLQDYGVCRYVGTPDDLIIGCSLEDEINNSTQLAGNFYIDDRHDSITVAFVYRQPQLEIISGARSDIIKKILDRCAEIDAACVDQIY